MQVKAQALRDIEKLIEKYKGYVRVADRGLKRNPDSVQDDIVRSDFSIVARDLQAWVESHEESFRPRKVVVVFLGDEFGYVAHDLPPMGADFYRYDAAEQTIRRALQQHLDKDEIEAYFTEEAK